MSRSVFHYGAGMDVVVRSCVHVIVGIRGCGVFVVGIAVILELD